MKLLEKLKSSFQRIENAILGDPGYANESEADAEKQREEEERNINAARSRLMVRLRQLSNRATQFRRVLHALETEVKAVSLIESGTLQAELATRLIWEDEFDPRELMDALDAIAMKTGGTSWVESHGAEKFLPGYPAIPPVVLDESPQLGSDYYANRLAAIWQDCNAKGPQEFIAIVNRSTGSYTELSRDVLELYDDRV